MMMESSGTTIAPVLVWNMVTSLFLFADKSLLNLSEKYKILQLLRYLLLSAFLFFLRLLPSLIPNLTSLSGENYSSGLKSFKNAEEAVASSAFSGDSGIARALSQLLSLVNDIPVSSRKYEIARSLTEKIIDENLQEGSQTLRQVNRVALSAAFTKTLSQLESRGAAMDKERGILGKCGAIIDGSRPGDFYGVNRVLRAVRYCGDMAWSRFGWAREIDEASVNSAEKLCAELLWLAQKLACCGYAEEAVSRWASANKLAWLAVWAEPRLQGSLVKISAFLLKQAKEMGDDEVDWEGNKREENRQTKLKLLITWLPLLCRASNGTDAPVLSINEKAELENVLEEIMEALEQEEDQEKVLSLWLHHFTRCPSSDWPNLRSCYDRWCNASRKLLVLRQLSDGQNVRRF